MSGIAALLGGYLLASLLHYMLGIDKEKEDNEDCPECGTECPVVSIGRTVPVPDPCECGYDFEFGYE